MDPLHTTLALGPLAVYLVLLGMINISRRPFMTTGSRDLYTLGIAVSGFAIIGPLNLFLPDGAVIRLGPLAWVLMIVLYALCLTLLVLLVRPRLVIYNITLEQLRPRLMEMMARLQWEHHWAGESLALPGLGVELHLDRFSAMRNSSLVATSARQSYYGWRRLEAELGAELRRVTVEPNPIGIAMIAIGLAVLGSSLTWIVFEREAVAQGLIEMLRL